MIVYTPSDLRRRRNVTWAHFRCAHRRGSPDHTQPVLPACFFVTPSTSWKCYWLRAYVLALRLSSGVSRFPGFTVLDRSHISRIAM